MSIGFDFSSGGGQQASFGIARDSIYGPQQRWLHQLWANASSLAQPGAARAGARNMFGMLAPGFQQGAQALGGLMDPTAQIAAQTGSLQSGLSQLFNETILPGIRGNAISAGAFGGGRQGVAEGVGAGQIAQAFTQGLGDITARANQQAMGAAGMFPQFAQGAMGTVGQQFRAGMEPLTQLAAILGNPAILNFQHRGAMNTGTGDSWGFSI